ncbi:lipopolysaccharide heptosyltransferase I [Trichlorobacter ammonificans]|uniref:Lipopolysaccharide heptosyltransferase 1 n=1 Tax=Trichlorobacter ammonificans TaxID=2916410 RepID=A0ABM9D5P2_9BACT|nr:lipopolysaccharide heptosyltransferase I [Trichlorobacter ammonificans]CAH2030476.1 Lipopolysaccharide heptosyltransferase I [Trichlorobacter ammonificans]
MRILIIKTSALGDVIHALPVLDFLKKIAPDATIDWVVEEPFLPLVAHNPLIGQVHVIRTRAWRRAPVSEQTRREISRLRQALHSARYDLVFDLQGNLKSGLVAWLTGTAPRVGFAADAVQEKLNLLFTTRRIPFRPQDNRAAGRYLRIVGAPFERDYDGLALATTIAAAPEDEATAATYLAALPEGPKVMLQVGTTWETKYWYPEGWVEVSRRILSDNPSTTLLINWGSPQEKELGERIIAEVGSAVRLLPWFKIKELIPVIQRMNLVIGGDTGPIYIAGAVGTPTVSLYRATRAELYAPAGPRHRAIQAPLDCSGCGRTRCERDQECRRSITADMVADAAISLLHETRTPNRC